MTQRRNSKPKSKNWPRSQASANTKTPTQNWIKRLDRPIEIVVCVGHIAAVIVMVVERLT